MCPATGQTCAQRPLGLLTAWLLQAADHDYSWEHEGADVSSFSTRKAARRMLHEQALPEKAGEDVEDFFKFEREQDSDTESEPEHIR